MPTVAVFNAHRRYRVRRRAIAAYVRSVLSGEGRRTGAIAVIFIDGPRSRSLNRKFLGHDYSTDVVSFLLEEGKNLEGEIYVNLDRARVQASRYDVSFGNEVARLVVHGTLHLTGFDDRPAAAARRMKEREERYLRKFFPAK